VLRADAIVVLGCKIMPSGRPSAAAARRADAAAAAYRAGVAPVVIASGGRRWGAHVESRVFGHALASAGVPRSAILTELCSLTTYENAIYSAALLRRLGARTAAVVTCGYHLPRALADFRAAGIEALPLAASSGDAGALLRVRRDLLELGRRLFDGMALRSGRPVVAASARALAPGLRRAVARGRGLDAAPGAADRE
jgi:uncharacterized SAM-binding protein YcdF (DUF218 family)